MFGLGTIEILLICFLFVAIFGLGKLPAVAKQLGKGVRNFKDSVEGKDEDDATLLEDQSSSQAARDASVKQPRESGELL